MSPRGDPRARSIPSTLRAAVAALGTLEGMEERPHLAPLSQNCIKPNSLCKSVFYPKKFWVKAWPEAGLEPCPLQGLSCAGRTSPSESAWGWSQSHLGSSVDFLQVLGSAGKFWFPWSQWGFLQWFQPGSIRADNSLGAESKKLDEVDLRARMQTGLKYSINSFWIGRKQIRKKISQCLQDTLDFCYWSWLNIKSPLIFFLVEIFFFPIPISPVYMYLYIYTYIYIYTSAFVFFEEAPQTLHKVHSNHTLLSFSQWQIIRSY